MSRKIILTTAKARLALAQRGKPYFVTIVDGISLGYRRNVGAGAWVVRKADGQGGDRQEGIGTADDIEPANGTSVLDYTQAVQKALNSAGRTSGPKTVAQAVADYKSDLQFRGKNPANADSVRFHMPPALMSRPVALLTEDELRHLRNGLLEKNLKRNSVVRVLKSVKAALNAAAPKRRLEFREALSGLSAEPALVDKVQPDEKVQALVNEAYALEPAYGRYLDVLASTGTRQSQALRILVKDLQVDRPDLRLMIPNSRKGGSGRNKEKRIPVSITRGLALRLKAAAAGREPNAPLLIRDDGSPWNPETKQLPDRFQKVAERVGISETEYCLRHSSITRMIKKNVPIHVVAQTHDTSVRQIEERYAAFITNHADDLVRGALIEMVPPLALVG